MGESEGENPRASLMRIEVLGKAEDHLVEGFQFYESQRLYSARRDNSDATHHKNQAQP